MFKKNVLILLASLGLTSSLSATAVDLNLFQSDFSTLMDGLAHDVAPSLRMGALAGDLQGDATIDHFSLTLPGFGLSVTNGLGRSLGPGVTEWQFISKSFLSDMVNSGAGSNAFFEHLMLFPVMKTTFGMAWNTWDFQVSGMYFPQALVDLSVNLAESDAGGTLHKLKPGFTFGNFGFQARKTVIADSGSLGLVPALSLGAGYHYSFFDLGVTVGSLKDLKMSPPPVGANETFDMSGPIHVTTGSHVLTADLQVSKHLLIFTPFFKLSGAYQNSTFTGNADMTAVITNDNGTVTTADDTKDVQKITAKPEVNVSDFGFLVTGGLEINLFITNFHLDVVGDLSRAFLKVSEFSLNGIDGNAFSINTGFRFSF